MRGIGARISRDEGMTLVEVVVAAAILFFVATGVLGLLGRTVAMSVQAEQMNASTNAVNSYVEWVRSLSLAQIDAGSVETTTFVTDEYRITIEPEITPGDNAALRSMAMTVTTQRGGQQAQVYETTIIIRDRDQNLTQGQRSPSTDPRIAFVSPTPPDGAVVWYDSGSWWRDAGGTTRPLQISVKVTPSTGRTIKGVELLGHNAWALEDSFGNVAQWLDPVWMTSPVFAWDLTQATSIGEPLVLEGTREVDAWVTDDIGARGQEARTFVVDNLPPASAPTPLAHALGATMAGQLSWPVVPDGSDPSSFGYEVQLWKQGPWGAGWTNIPGYNGPGTTFDIAGDPMSRYAARARAYSPRGLSSGYTDWTLFVTRPKLTGTYDVVMTTTGGSKGWKVTAKLQTTPPSFETMSGTTSYKWYANDVLMSTTTTSTYTMPLLTRTTSGSEKVDATTFPARAYKVVVTTTPGGYGGGTPVTLTSNVALSSAPPSSGTYTLPEGAW